MATQDPPAWAVNLMWELDRRRFELFLNRTNTFLDAGPQMQIAGIIAAYVRKHRAEILADTGETPHG